MSIGDASDSSSSDGDVPESRSRMLSNEDFLEEAWRDINYLQEQEPLFSDKELGHFAVMATQRFALALFNAGEDRGIRAAIQEISVRIGLRAQRFMRASGELSAAAEREMNRQFARSIEASRRAAITEDRVRGYLAKNPFAKLAVAKEELGLSESTISEIRARMDQERSQDDSLR